MSERVLVTGGLGFIGSHLVDALVGRGKKVVVLDALHMGSNIGNSNSAAEYIVMNLANKQRVVTYLTEKGNCFTEIYHLAAESHVDRAIDDAQPFIDSNITGTYNLFAGLAKRAEDDWRFGLEHKYPRVLLFSTDEVMGELSTGSFSEADPTAPKNMYSMTKLAQEGIARSFFHSHGVPVVTTRCSNIYGPRQGNEKFIPTIIRSIRDESAQIPVYGDGLNVREWTYVSDAIDATMFAMEHVEAGDIIHIGSSHELTNIDVVNHLLDYMLPNQSKEYKESRIKFVEDRKGHDRRYFLDCSKLISLGWHPKVCFRDGLKNMFKY